LVEATREALDCSARMRSASRDQQILDAIKTRQQKAVEPEWGRMSDGEFLKERMRRYGF
jgi:hypothetical protein